MSIHTTIPAHAPFLKLDLSRDATLVKLSICQFTGRRKDVDLAAESAQKHNADSKAVEAYLTSLAKDDRQPIQKIATAARQHLNFNSSFWDDGRRLVANSGYEKLRTELEQYGLQFRAAVDSLVSRHAELEVKARADLGKLFNRCGFPTREALRDEYSFDVITEPITNPADIRLRHVSASVVREIEESTRKVHQGKVKDAVKQLLTRMQEVVERIAKTCGDKDAIFRDTMISNVSALCDVVPALNITNDPFIRKVTDEIRGAFAGIEPQVLREEPKEREKVAKLAGSIADKLRKFRPSDDV